MLLLFLSLLVCHQTHDILECPVPNSMCLHMCVCVWCKLRFPLCCVCFIDWLILNATWWVSSYKFHEKKNQLQKTHSFRIECLLLNEHFGVFGPNRNRSKMQRNDTRKHINHKSKSSQYYRALFALIHIIQRCQVAVAATTTNIGIGRALTT